MMTQIVESILSKLWESFCSRVVEQTADDAHNNVKYMKDFEIILETLQKNLSLLNAKACDVEEEIKNAELSGGKKRKREVEIWLGEVKSIEKRVVKLGSQVESEGFVMRFMDGGIASKLNDEVEKLLHRSRNFGELVLDVCGIRGETFLTNGLVGGAFNENLESILKLLESRRVSSIGVYGMGGVGKTTLAKHIHNRLLQQSQGPVFWVTVSQEFTIKSLQDKIARFLGVNLLDEDEEDIRAARLHRALSEMKNSVLILDDVWEYIDMLKVGCPFSVECCRLIITTRSLEVCRQTRCQKVILVEKLRKDESWMLFIETLGKEIQLGRRVEGIAKSMAKMCDGLPLGIITVAGSMRGETSIHTWTNALIELKECVVGQDGNGDDMVFKVLKYSFDRLNRNHQSEFNTFQLCFLYCSLYPEDEKINREHLVRKFISEGLVDERKRRREQYHKGHSILEKLVNVCLLETCAGHECVKMHDLVRGMALKIGKRIYMVRAGDYSLNEAPDEEEWTQDLEKVSLMKSGITRIRDGISPNSPNLSTLLLCGNPLEIIPNSFFSKMQLLCTLDLCETRITMLPGSICEMRSLKALLLWNCKRLEKVPYLGKLQALNELNLSYTAIEEVPRGVEELHNLKFLSINTNKLEWIRGTLPRGLLLKLGHLQHLDFPFHIQIPIEEIEHLRQLEEFRGGVKNVNDLNRFMRRRVDDSCYTIGVGIGFYNADYYGIGYSEYSGCNELILNCCNLRDESVLGEETEQLRINKCEGLSICFLDNFAGLKKLRIERCGGIECILRSEKGISNTLEDIKLVRLEDLKCVMQKGGVSSLRKLDIYRCNKMRKVGFAASGIPNLEAVHIRECGEMEEIFEDEGRGCPKLPKLKELILEKLGRLKWVCKATMICHSIALIHIRECPRLTNKLPVHVDDPPTPTLRGINVEREWWESMEWDNPNLAQLLHSRVEFD